MASLATKDIALLKNKSVLLIFLLAGAAFLHWTHIPDADEGVILNGAWNLINGRRLYIDFFEFIPPGAFYLLFWWWKVVGVSYATAKLLALAFLSAAVVGFWRIIFLFSKRSTPIMSAIFVLLTIPWIILNHNAFSTAALLWAAYFFLRGIQSRHWTVRWWIGAGIGLGTGFLFLQHRSLAFLVAAVTWWLIWGRKDFSLKIFLAFLLVSLAASALLLFFWPAKLLLNNLIISPLFRYSGINFYPLGPWILVFFIWLFWGIYLRIWQKRRLSFLWSLQLFFLISVLPRADISHLSQVIWPLLVGLGCIYRPQVPWPVRWMIKISLVGLALLFLLNWTKINGQWMGIKNFKLSQEVIPAVENNCSSPYLYAGPFAPNLYFETRKLNATSFSFLLTGMHTPAMFQQAAEELKDKKPDCALLNYAMVKKFNYQLDNPVDQYLRKHYRPIARWGHLELYKIISVPQ
ncbi:hypothetical protein D6821_00745 [Candidatus Parcubacteria bacterium]|nr:MAG: hypothetical protein D6821_00745 [Candidatus Parcubacteria bacterium]